jgi:CRISPR-associated protein Cas1
VELTKVALVDEYGAYLHIKDGRFRLKVGDSIKWDAAPVELDSIVFVVDGASLSASSVELAAEFGIDLVFLKGSRPVARLVPAKYGSTMRIWQDQLVWSSDEGRCAALASLFILGKIHNQRMVLYEYAQKARAAGKRSAPLDQAVEQLASLQGGLSLCQRVQEVLNVEAHAANVYWRGVANLLPSELGFQHRLTRQRLAEGAVPDPFNIALNIGYSILRKEVWRAVFLAGLNPYVGFLHRPRAGRMSLVLDLMEEFRPHCVDRPLIALARQKPDVILRLGKGGLEEGRKEVWRAVLERMKEREDMVSLIVHQARLLAQHLRGTGTYKPFKSRW